MRYTFLLLILIVFFTQGCGKEENSRRADTEYACKSLIGQANVSAISKGRAKKVLDRLKNKILDDQPILVNAGYNYREDTNECWVYLTMSDEGYDISGVILNEIHSKPAFEIEENYKVFPPGIGHPMLLIFKKREDPSQKKDRNAWELYEKSEEKLLRSTFIGIKYPDIYVSIPKADEVEVRISVYDSKGNKSEPVILVATLHF